MSILILKW